MVIFSPAGDTEVATWSADDEAAVELARGKFDQAIREGWGAVAPAAGGAQRVETFSPELEEVILLRPIAGG
jgi:hypothetical protein